ncbi:hypothetical protein R3P38DRAFT_2721474 [Favolaschia claudopus]|uniref:Uncharacterized protein n=1 Tax=Favolaschia claudopus TaxID=2862362 RepID=A0AAW0AK14_9AGAR
MGEPRRTRRGTRFSPWESFISWQPDQLTALGFKVHQTAVSLEELVEAAEAGKGDGDGGGGETTRAEESDDDEVVSPTDISRCTSPEPFHLPALATPRASTSFAPPVSPPAQSPPPEPSHQDLRKKSYNKQRRQRKRQLDAASPFTHKLNLKSIPTHNIVRAHRVKLDASELKTTKGGHYLGHRDPPKPKPKGRDDSARWADLRLRKLRELVELGHIHVKWDGKGTLLILDRTGRIIVVFVGGPDDPDWPSVVEDATVALDRAREEGISTDAFASDAGLHRRGRFLTLKSGVSHGTGQKHPKNVDIPSAKKRLVDALLEHQSIRRICGFQSSAFRTWAPKLFKDYVSDLRSLFENDPNLKLNFTNSIFPSVTFNLGPQSASFEHIDDLNRALGWCAITNGGHFDSTRSALLYLRELNLIVDFPSAATSFIPSAVVHHGNTPLAPHETRYSITQYAAGGLFRYVNYKFRTANQVLAAGGEELKQSLDGLPGERHKRGVELFSKPESLIADHIACFSKSK